VNGWIDEWMAKACLSLSALEQMRESNSHAGLGERTKDQVARSLLFLVLNIGIRSDVSSAEALVTYFCGTMDRLIDESFMSKVAV
jgi:hypothetical protein